MKKLILGIIAVLALHVGFVAFFATLDTLETVRREESLAKPTNIPEADQPVREDTIIVARGTIPAAARSEEPVADKRVISGPPAIVGSERRTSDGPRVIKIFKPQPKRVAPLYQTMANTVDRAEFPRNMTFAASDNSRLYSASVKKTGRGEKRSFFSKVGSIVKKPYDALKAVASWLR